MIKIKSENSIQNNYSIFYIYNSIKIFVIFAKKIVTTINKMKSYFLLTFKIDISKS